MDANAAEIRRNKKGEVTGVVYVKNGKRMNLSGDYVISSMPMKDLVMAMDGVPKKYIKIADGLPYRDFITVGVLLSKMALKNETKMKTLGNIVPYNWVYVQDKDIKMGRFQIYNNWSPYLVKDVEHRVWMGLEYFCNKDDDFWMMSDDEIAKMAVSEMIKIGVVKEKKDVLDYNVERVEKAYPAYFGSYVQIDELRKYLDKIPNLFLVGRNGQHRYNNLDHSMCTAFEAVKNILAGVVDKTNIWNVNTEGGYHEE